MSKSNTADRLRQIMNERNLRQVDVIEMCQPYCKKYGVILNKSHLSQYLKGSFLPKQDKLTVLAHALGVSEVWLMGYDVDPLPKTETIKKDLTPAEQQFISQTRKINAEGKEMLMKYLNYLESEYKKRGESDVVQKA